MFHPRVIYKKSVFQRNESIFVAAYSYSSGRTGATRGGEPHNRKETT